MHILSHDSVTMVIQKQNKKFCRNSKPTTLPMNHCIILQGILSSAYSLLQTNKIQMITWIATPTSASFFFPIVKLVFGLKDSPYLKVFPSKNNMDCSCFLKYGKITINNHNLIKNISKSSLWIFCSIKIILVVSDHKIIIW